MAAGAITEETKLLFLDAIFHLAPRAVNLVVESLRATFQIGQNITRISAFYGVFGFRNDPSFPVPTLSLILKLSEEPHFFSAPLVLALSPFLQLGRERMQALILSQSDDVVDSRSLAPTQHLPTTKAAVGTHGDCGLCRRQARNFVSIF